MYDTKYKQEFTDEELNNEVWKDVGECKGYEELARLYEVSNLGRVKNKKGLIMSPELYQRGYYRVHLYKNNKRKHARINRLVALAFIPNPNNYPMVNHKDENKLNNKVSNLEWCTAKYNANYGTTKERAAKPLYQLDMNGNIIKEFNSAHQVQKVLGYNVRAIAGCCEGNCKSAYGYKWKYKQ